MNASDLFRELGWGDDELNEAREWVNYKHFAETVPDVLTLNEYISTIYKRTIDTDAKPHTWFSERYMQDKYLSSNVVVDEEYISKLKERVSKIKGSTNHLPPHISAFLTLIVETVTVKKTALPKQCLIFLNDLYRGKQPN